MGEDKVRRAWGGEMGLLWMLWLLWLYRGLVRWGGELGAGKPNVEVGL
jgi:hypothetical protein